MKEIEKLNIAANEILSLAMDQLDQIQQIMKLDPSNEAIREAEDKLSTLTDAYTFILYRMISKTEKL
jgi:hypothetical protein